jgi:hypothetical protein
MKIKYGIVAYSRIDDEFINIEHQCFYEHPPTNNNFLSLTEELNTDPDFHPVGRIGVDVFLMECPEELIRETISKLGTDEV